MASRERWAAFGIAAIAGVALFAGACGDDDDDGGGTPPPQQGENVIAPYGFKFELQSAAIPADPTTAATPPTVTFRVTVNDAPVEDLQQRIKNGPAGTTPPSGFPYVRAPNFTLSRLEPDGTYRSYYLNAASASAPAGTQAASVPMPGDDTAWADRVTALGNGAYRFELSPLPANPTAEERARTHTVGVYGSHFQAQGAAEQPATSTLNFVPAGGAAQLDQVVSAAACNTCHGPAVRAHGRRLGVQLCLTCHTSQTSDPQSGNSVEMTEMIHKIHYGGGRPGAPYEIIGFNNTTFTFDAPFINDVRNCTLCHQGEDADRHLTAPTQQACTTCHSVVKFDASAAASCNPEAKDGADCNHLPIAAGTACNTCHNPDQLRSSHVPMTQVAQQFRYEIQSVTVDAGRIPTARVRVLDTQTNQARDLETDAAYKQPTSSLNVKFGWPSKEYTNVGASTTAPGQPVSVQVVAAGALRTTGVTKVAGQTGVYDVASSVAVPAGVTSATALMDGHPVVHGENVPVVNVTSNFPVGGGAVEARRKVVAVESCNTCHGVVSAHGQNRNGSIEGCVVCHNPKATDWQRRQGIPDPAEAALEQSVDFKVLIHAVHAADIRRDDFVVYGFGSARHAFPGEIPHGVGNCNLCHVNQSWKLPLAAEVLDPVVTTGGTPGNQGDDVTAGKVRMICTACHDQTRFAQATPALPLCSTLPTVNAEPCIHSGGPAADDTGCAACHGPGGPADIATKHPIR